jgi:hypothetical protein
MPGRSATGNWGGGSPNGRADDRPDCGPNGLPGDGESNEDSDEESGLPGHGLSDGPRGPPGGRADNGESHPARDTENRGGDDAVNGSVDDGAGDPEGDSPGDSPHDSGDNVPYHVPRHPLSLCPRA